MPLATVMLLLSISPPRLSSLATLLPAQSTPQSAAASASGTQASQGQIETSAPQVQPSQSKQSSAGKPSTTSQKPQTVQKRIHKKTAAIAPCDAGSTTSGSTGSNSNTPAASLTDPSSTQASANPPAATNCPPEKIVVRHGGTGEPSIQLAGGDQAAQKRDAANQLLNSTEANLKKLAGLQLSSPQQDTVSQIRQFVEQAKTALESGDVERGHTLAWKAELLSEDLVNPPK